ncbi:MAG: hypothetical protein ABIQ60_15175 [Burkholderiaceae bacterium]
MAKAPVTPPSQPDGSEPLLPHERDQKADATDGEPSERVRKGAKDLQRGVEDTSRSIEADRAYRDLKKR